ncbi:hypothetical protein GPL21_00280 [Bradyrhizobium pachyrhizi]|uniref:Uncharacterized protein n=1 Tax=Bradyrhizobium pachyrhizi TaxID=280333 RepID=A0A844SM59_9BRAD|nr:hypothetical protein [Bradyrhizobium pachyrhizi]MVT63550.1 hypothetical protein [Bradyrhizobium pachyrhizi]
MEHHRGLDFSVVQSLSPRGWKWIIHLGQGEKIGGTHSDRQSAIKRAKQFIDDYTAKNKRSEDEEGE